MFERTTNKYDAYFLPGPAGMPTDESLTVGLRWLLSQAGEPLIVLGRKGNVSNNRLLEAAVKITASSTPHHLASTNQGGTADPFSCRGRAKGLCSRSTTTSPTIDPAVAVAMKHASQSINHNNGLVTDAEKAIVVLTLKELVRGGYTYDNDVDQFAAWAIADGWYLNEIPRLREYATKALEGRSFRLRHPWGPRKGAVKQWEGEAAANAAARTAASISQQGQPPWSPAVPPSAASGTLDVGGGRRRSAISPPPRASSPNATTTRAP